MFISVNPSVIIENVLVSIYFLKIIYIILLFFSTNEGCDFSRDVYDEQLIKIKIKSDQEDLVYLDPLYLCLREAVQKEFFC